MRGRQRNELQNCFEYSEIGYAKKMFFLQGSGGEDACFWPLGAGAAWRKKPLKIKRKLNTCSSSLGKIGSIYGKKNTCFTCFNFHAVLH